MTWKQNINKWQFILSVLAFIILFVSLYQLEIITVNALNNAPFCLPFLLTCTKEYWIWRDVFYTGIILAFFMLLYAIWRWE